MAEFGEENKVQGVFGGVNFSGEQQEQAGNMNNGIEFSGNDGVNIENNNEQNNNVFTKIDASQLPVKQTAWSKIKAFLFKEIDLTAPIKVELTPYQQKVEDEINEFLHQEISFKGFFNIFKKKNKENV